MSLQQDLLCGALAGNVSESHAGRRINQALVCLGKYLAPFSLFFWFLVSCCCHSPLVLSLAVISVHGMLADCVEDPVHLGSPAAMVSIVHLLHEVVQGLLLRLVQGQGLSDVSDVIK